MITGSLFFTLVVEDVDRTRRVFRDLFGLLGQRMEPDSYLGSDKGARIAFRNRCWLYIVESHQAESPLAQYLERRGPGLERVAFLSDDVEAEFQRVRQNGVPLGEDALADTSVGRRFSVPSEYVSGITVEVMQPSPRSWDMATLANDSGILGLQHVGGVVRDLPAVRVAFERLFDLPPAPIDHAGHLSITPGNDYHWLDLAQRRGGESDRLGTFLQEKGEGLEHLCFEVRDVRRSVKRVIGAGAEFYDNRVYTNRPNGLEAFIYPEYTTAVTVELIEPYPTSPGYRW
jgi:methylmalonyl-CoA/ethylmalonyl-CoA epimerase